MTTAQLIDPAAFRAMTPERREAIAHARRLQVAQAKNDHWTRYHAPRQHAPRRNAA